jgi:hypothetical protein
VTYSVSLYYGIPGFSKWHTIKYVNLKSNGNAMSSGIENHSPFAARENEVLFIIGSIEI